MCSVILPIFIFIVNFVASGRNKHTVTVNYLRANVRIARRESVVELAVPVDNVELSVSQ